MPLKNHNADCVDAREANVDNGGLWCDIDEECMFCPSVLRYCILKKERDQIIADQNEDENLNTLG